jgi:hypothetical protein
VMRSFLPSSMPITAPLRMAAPGRGGSVELVGFS